MLVAAAADAELETGFHVLAHFGAVAHLGQVFPIEQAGEAGWRGFLGRWRLGWRGLGHFCCFGVLCGQSRLGGGGCNTGGPGVDGAAGGFFLAFGGEHKVVRFGACEMRLFLGVEDFVQALLGLGHVGGVAPVAEVFGFDEQKHLARRVGDEHVGQLAAQAFVAQVGVRVERDVRALQGQVVAARDLVQVAVELDDALGIAGREFIEEVAGKELGAEVTLFFGFDEGGVREDHRQWCCAGRAGG